MTKPTTHEFGINERGDYHTHIRGMYGNNGEDESVLSVHAMLDPGQNFPSCARIIIGSPTKSPLIDGALPLPELSGFSCSADAAEQLIEVLRRAVQLVRAAEAVR